MTLCPLCSLSAVFFPQATASQSWSTVAPPSRRASSSNPPSTNLATHLSRVRSTHSRLTSTAECTKKQTLPSTKLLPKQAHTLTSSTRERSLRHCDRYCCILHVPSLCETREPWPRIASPKLRVPSRGVLECCKLVVAARNRNTSTVRWKKIFDLTPYLPHTAQTATMNSHHGAATARAISCLSATFHWQLSVR